MKTKKKNMETKKQNRVFTSFEKQFDKTMKRKNINIEKQIIHDIRKATQSSHYHPKNDYYSFINERWLHSFKVENNMNYIVQIDNFRLTQDKVYHQLLSIIENEISKKNSFLSIQLKNFYESTNKNKSKHALMKSYAYQHIKKIMDYQKEENGLWKLLGYFNQNEIVSWGVPIVWSVNADDKDPKHYRCFVGGPKLSILDLNVYFDDGEEVEYKKKSRKKFEEYVNSIFQYFFGEQHPYQSKDVFEVEKSIIETFECEKWKEKKEKTYFRIEKEESLKKYGFPWEIFAKEIGYEHIPSFFITSDVNFLSCICDVLKEKWNTEKWTTYWIYIYIRQLMRFTKKGGEIYYEYNGKYVKGMESSVDDYLYKLFPISFAFNTFLSKEYIRKYKNEQVIQYVRNMAEDLKMVFKRIIERNDWLAPQTKKKALRKLDLFQFKFGNPEKLVDDPHLVYSNHDIWHNLSKVSFWRTKKAIQLEGKPLIDIPIIDWSQIPPKMVGSQSYVVNASYTPNQNCIYVPLGYLQKPFVDLEERGIEYNLAHIGFTLGHEMSHSLDDWGSEYDEMGVLKNWWTEHDKKIFHQIQKDVINQYETFASYDKIDFDASPSIGEDLADISGLNICIEYLRDFQEKNKDILPIRQLSFTSFFVYFAYQQRQIINKKAIESQLKSNPHPLDKYRCNVPLSRIPLFREIYNIKKKDKMWWNSTNRVWEN
jgi:predicted metalloendopeptidase